MNLVDETRFNVDLGYRASSIRKWLKHNKFKKIAKPKGDKFDSLLKNAISESLDKLVFIREVKELEIVEYYKVSQRVYRLITNHTAGVGLEYEGNYYFGSTEYNLEDDRVITQIVINDLGE